MKTFPLKAGWLTGSVFLASMLLLTACDSNGQTAAKSDFAVLAQSAKGYAQARPGQALVFPRDHGAHPEFRIEWWYLTANLESPRGRTYGAQWTLFRLAIQEPDTPEPLNAWQSRQVFMGHFAITTPERHLSFQRYSRGRANHALARAGVIAAPFEAWLDDWTLRSSGESFLPLEVKARQGDHSLHFDLESDKPLVLHGQDGFSQKHPNGGGSFYYSQPFLTVNGELELAGERIPVTGKAWIDHEWSSQFLQGDQEGWDWFSLHLENGEKLMLFQLRQSVDSAADKPYRYGVLIRTDGSTVQLDPHEIQLSVLKTTELEGRKLPLSWQVELPQIERSFEIQALHPDQWMEVDFPYWEGVIGAFGDGPQNRGPGYMELTGYPVE